MCPHSSQVAPRRPERHSRAAQLFTDEEEGERRLREIWDEEVEREGEDASGAREESSSEGDQSDEEDGDDNLGRETGDEDPVECILGERSKRDKVEVRVRWVEGGEETWEPVEG